LNPCHTIGVQSRLICGRLKSSREFAARWRPVFSVVSKRFMAEAAALNRVHLLIWAPMFMPLRRVGQETGLPYGRSLCLPTKAFC
jgi:hypothetical protein